MFLIYLSLTIALLWINLAGLNALMRRYIPTTASARALGLAGLILVFFALEHLHGLGKLAWLWPLSTAAALWQLKSVKGRAFWIGESVFALGFLYGLAWRFAYPNIDAGSEHLTDLYFINNYRAGETLPPPDYWWADGKFDCYYALQHYAAALLARWFNLETGLAMNLSWSLLLGLLVSLGWEISGYFVKPLILRGLLVATLISGGNGLSPLMPAMLVEQTPQQANSADAAVKRVWASTRFAGMYDQQVNLPLGRWVAGDPAVTDIVSHLELPLESIGFYTVLGDYHPPLGGFIIALLTLALAGFLGWPAKQGDHSRTLAQDRQAPYAAPLAFFGLGLTPALVLVTNAWVLPLQAILLGTWLLFRQRRSNIHWSALILGGSAGFALIYPFLGYFAVNAMVTPLRWVTITEHSPLRFWLAIHWPLLLWLALGLYLTRYATVAAWLVLVGALILGLSELVLVDDPLEGKYQRFNTLLKWWSWLWPTTLIGLGSVCIGLGGRVIQTLMVLSLTALLTYTLDLGRYWAYVAKPQLGKLAGNDWLKQDGAHREILAYLQNAPPGIVLEAMTVGAYSPATALSLFAGKPVLLGWPDHLAQWHGQSAALTNRVAAVRAFYQAELPDPLGFLSQFPVRYILWARTDELSRPGLRLKIDAQIGRDYHWRAFDMQGVGLWERRDQTK